MRRARVKLQVSTFPFLAVLLCAMGALVLFLLVMDRRAKLVARNKSQDAQVAFESKKQKLEQAEQAEYEQKKQRVDQLVQVEHQKANADLRMAQGVMSDAERDLRAQQAKLNDLKQNRDRENSELAKLEALLNEKRAGLKESERLELAKKQELDRLLANIRDLEKKADDLKNRKEAEKQTYSLVPYKGKRGDSRKPIYVECRNTGWMFHPEKNTLEGANLTPEKLRTEIERRAGELRRESKTKEIDGKNPYVLFLVRPDGIEHYYKANHFLKGFALDFGSEMVDAQWAFEFPASDVATAPPPLPINGQGTHTTLRPPPLSLPNPPIAGASGTPVPEPPSVRLSNEPSPGTAGSTPLLIRVPDLTQGTEATRPELPLPPPPLTLVPSEKDLGNAKSNTAPPPIQIGIDTPPPMRLPASNLVEVPSTVGTEPPPSKPSVPAFVPLWKMPGPTPIAEAGMNAGKPIAEAGPAVKPLLIESLPGLTSTPRTPEDLTKEPTTPAPSNKAPARSESSNGAGSDDLKPSPFNANSAQTGAANNNRAPAPTLSRQLGSKEFVVTIDCYADHVTVFPGGQQFRYTSGSLQQTNQALVGHVRQLIERRQATVRGGEPPYQPRVKFQLTPEGHRTYFEAYPQLQSLRVPMTRENLSE